MRGLLVTGPLLAVLLLTACQGPDAEPETTAFTDCGTLTAPIPPSTASTGATASIGVTAPAGADGEPPAGGVAAGRPLPALSLPCFTGHTQVAVDALRGPAVINLWASWCAPCRTELPALQRLSTRSTDRLRVIGVNTRDGRSAAQSIGEDFGLTFPTVFDPEQKLLRELGRAVLPITLFVDGKGRIRHRDETGALDDAELTELVRLHLGVAVPS